MRNKGQNYISEASFHHFATGDPFYRNAIKLLIACIIYNNLSEDMVFR